MMHIGFWSDFLNQNKLKPLMDPRAFGELENIGYFVCNIYITGVFQEENIKETGEN